VMRHAGVCTIQKPVITLRSRRFFFCVLFLLVTLMAASVCASVQQSRKEVLYINSYDKGQEWSDPITQAIGDQSASSGLDVNLPEGSIIINQPKNVRLVTENELWSIFIGCSGLIIGIAIMIIALLRIRRTRDALDASEKRYRAVVEDQSELISRVLPDGTHIFVNDSYCRFFEKTRDDIIGKQFIPQLSDEEKLRIYYHLKFLTPQNPISGITNRVILENGESRWLFWNNRAIFDKDGNIVEYQSVGRDITDVKLAEEKVRQYIENLEEQIAKRTQELVNSNT
jgi:PAS domain S-box-containing protein